MHGFLASSAPLAIGDNDHLSSPLRDTLRHIFGTITYNKVFGVLVSDALYRRLGCVVLETDAWGTNYSKHSTIHSQIERNSRIKITRRILVYFHQHLSATRRGETTPSPFLHKSHHGKTPQAHHDYTTRTQYNKPSRHLT